MLAADAASYRPLGVGAPAAVIEIVALIGLSVVVFASTNIDDLFVLLGFFADRRSGAASVAIGQFAGIGALVAASALGSLVSLVLSRPYVGLLGVLPILIGARKLFDLGGNDGDTPARESRGGALARIASPRSRWQTEATTSVSTSRGSPP